MIQRRAIGLLGSLGALVLVVACGDEQSGDGTSGLSGSGGASVFDGSAGTKEAGASGGSSGKAGAGGGPTGGSSGGGGATGGASGKAGASGGPMGGSGGSGTAGTGGSSGGGGAAQGGSGGSGVAGGPVGPSWDTSDPPTQDAAKAAAHCNEALQAFNETLPGRRADAKIADLNTLYHLERLFHGASGVYEVTGNEQVVSDLLDIALDVVDAGEHIDQDEFLDYCFRDENGNVTSDGCDDLNNEDLGVTYPWRAMRGPARALRAAASSSLRQSRAADFEKLRYFLAHDVIDKWLDLDGAGPDDIAGGSHTSCIDARMAGILLDYFFATGDPRIGEMAREWILWVASDMQPSPDHAGAYWFDNWLQEGSEYPACDTSHGNETVGIIIEGFEAGFIPYSYVAPLQSTLLDVMWDGNVQTPLFKDFIDGSGDSSPNSVVLAWMRLAQFKGKTQQAVENLDYGAGYDLANIEANGNYCRIYGLAQTNYPLTYPAMGVSAPGGSPGLPGLASQTNCGDEACGPQSKTCCIRSFTPYNYNDYPSCYSDCDATPVLCDGPEDCGGNACCGMFGRGWQCSDSPVCPMMDLQLCHSTQDCSTSQPHCCGSTGLQGFFLSACSPFGASACN